MDEETLHQMDERTTKLMLMLTALQPRDDIVLDCLGGGISIGVGRLQIVSAYL